MSYSNDDEMFFIAAERYAMGRRTYIVSTVAQYIKNRVPKLSDWCLGFLKQDYEEKQREQERCPDYKMFGDECDKKDWDAMYAAVTQELGRRKHAT